QNDVTLKMPAFEWVHVQLHQQKGMISLSPPTICNSALATNLPVEIRTPKQLVNIYSKRMQIEETFRDLKSPAY
ncbi:transposase, partial [Escherichia coli]